ncbi:MAG TPA: pilus assembly protein TadG-related protein [Planctomicrobium sp.]|nr:pilus assembly protein TadG-related protein [Planctomicrobium sp.]
MSQNLSSSHKTLQPERAGYVLILVAVALPTIFCVIGLVIDSSLLMVRYRQLQSLADVASTTAARELSRGKSVNQAKTAAINSVREQNGMMEGDVTVEIPPVSGPFSGKMNYVAVNISRGYDTYFMRIIPGSSTKVVRTRAVAGMEDATAGTVIALLDPDPTPITVTGLPLGIGTLSLPHIQLGALELLGIGQLRVQGAVIVNAGWGRVDENGQAVGDSVLPPYGISCTPLLPLTKLLATDVRVSGGVDRVSNYGNIQSGGASPLTANRMPVPDPLRNLPVPTVSVDSRNVNATLRGGRTIIALPGIPLLPGLPLLNNPTILEPGVYEWIEVVSGQVIFRPGVYIIRNVNPLTGIALSVVGGQITAEGVMFYITSNTNYSAITGGADAAEGQTPPPPLNQTTLLPSVVINLALLGSSYSGLNDSGSPFHGITIYQQRHSRKPMVLVAEQLLGPASISGMIYSKWGQLIFAANGNYDLRIVAGTARIVNVLQTTLSPSQKLPPATDVFLVQ